MHTKWRPLRFGGGSIAFVAACSFAVGVANAAPLPLPPAQPQALLQEDKLLVTFDFNTAVNGQTAFAPTVDRVPGLPTLTLNGTNVDPVRAAGTAFTDVEGTNYPAGLSIGYTLPPAFGGGNNISVIYDSTGYTGGVVFSFDYRSTSISAMTAGPYSKPVSQGGSLLKSWSYDLVTDGQWHHETREFRYATEPYKYPNGEAEIRIGPNLTQSQGVLQFDNIQVVGITPEPTGVALLLVVAGATLRRRRSAGSR